MASSAQALAAQLADLTRRLAALERGSQLSHSTFPGPNEAPVRVVDGLRAGVEAGSLAAEAIERATSAEAKADGAVVSFFGDEEPEGAKEGDLWRKTSGDVLQYVGGEWVAVSDPEIRADLDEALGRLSGAEEALDGKVTTYFRPESDPPSGQAVGDLWIVEGTNELRRWDGFAWIDARDVGIEEALTEAGNAKSAAEQAWRDAGDAKRDATSALESAAGKTRVTFSPDDPSADGTTGGDIWFKRDDRDRIVGQWEWDADSAQWLPVTLSSEVIAGLDVGKLTVGTAEVSTGVVEHLLAKNVQLPGTLRATQDSFELTLSGRGVTMLSKQAATFSHLSGDDGTNATEVNVALDGLIYSRAEWGSDVIVGRDPATGAIVRQIPGTGATAYWLAEHGGHLYTQAAPSSTGRPRLRVLTPTGSLVRYITLPAGAGVYSFTVMDDGRIVGIGGLELRVFSSTGSLLRRIQLPGGERYSPTSLASYGDLVFEGFGDTINIWRASTGDLAGTWRVGPGSLYTLTVHDGTLYVPLTVLDQNTDDDTVAPAYVLGFNLDTMTEAFHWQVEHGIAGINSLSGITFIDGTILATYANRLGTLTVSEADSIRASISTATGSVLFQDAELRGVTRADVVDARQVGTGRHKVELFSPYTRSGVNVFYNAEERDAVLGEFPTEGTEAVTRSPELTVWRREGNAWVEKQVNGELRATNAAVTGTLAVDGMVHVKAGASLNVYGRIYSGSGNVHVDDHLDVSGSVNADGAVRTPWVGQDFAPIYFENIGGGRIRQPTVRSTSTTANANVYVGSNGVLALSTSTLKNKVAVEDAPEEWAERLLDVSPRTWFDRVNAEAYADLLDRQERGEEPSPEEADAIERLRRIPGLVAEEVEDAGLSAYVNYDADGKVIGLAYDRLWTLLVPLVKRQRDKIDALEARLDALEARLAP